MSYILRAVLMGAVLFTLVPSCQKAPMDPVPDASVVDASLQVLKEATDQTLLAEIRLTGRPFDWNNASTDLLMDALLLTDHLLAVGYAQNGWNDASAKVPLTEKVRRSEGREDVVRYSDDRLGVVYFDVRERGTLEMLRSHSSVTFLEIPAYPILIDELTAAMTVPKPVVGSDPAQRVMVLDPQLTTPEYAVQVSLFSGSTGTSIFRHNVDHVYRDHQIFGEGIGVAILDNGLLPSDFQFLQDNGYGERSATGFYNPLWFLPFTQPDGYSPQPPDVLFLSQLVEGQWLHGRDMNEQVLCIAPNAYQKTVRSSPLVLLLFPAQVIGVINGIVAMADDPEIDILSMSMGSLFVNRHMEHAINYLNSKDKILVAAAGTSFVILKDLIGVIFPASLESTVAATGIVNRAETNGVFELGEAAHGGPEVDFCIERNSASSEATSRLAGMIALIWSADPGLTRQEVIDIAVQSSYFYQNNGQKDPVFGWGTPDIQAAVESALTN